MADSQITIIEQWKAIPDFPGYEVSDQGRVRSYWRKGIRGQVGIPVIKKQYRRGNYFFVPLQQNKIGKNRDVHRLVLETFIGSCPPGMESCHNDGNTLRNHLVNLRWDTPFNNTQDKYKHGTIYTGEKHWSCKLSDENVKEIRHLSSLGCKGINLAKRFNVTTSLISLIINNKHR